MTETLWADYTTARPDLTPFYGVMRYLDIMATGTKGLTPAEIADLEAKGKPIGLIWETSANAAAEGAPRAVDHAARANAEADRLGAPKDVAIFYAVDFDATPAQVTDYVTTLLTQPGRPVGIYGSYTITVWARTVGVKWTWQTLAWSKGLLDLTANLYQREFPTGYDVNLERNIFPAWGRPLPAQPIPEEPPVPAIYWRGVRVCACMPAPLTEAARLVTVRTKAAGVPDWTLTPIQGSYSTTTAASFGTHDGGGAIDLKMSNLGAKQKVILEAVMREVGFASWNREPSWWSAWFGKILYGGWSSHNHSVQTGCPHLSTSAKGQIAEYVRGENGLTGGDKDTGTRAFVGRTWAAYLAIKNAVVGIGGAVVDAERIKGIQRALRLTVDGKMGPQTYGAVWRLSKASRDGRKGFLSMSLENRKALQRNIGCKFVDGGWIALGSEMPKRVRDAMGGFQSAMGLPIDRVWTDATEGKQFGALMARVGYRP